MPLVEIGKWCEVYHTVAAQNDDLIRYFLLQYSLCGIDLTQERSAGNDAVLQGENGAVGSRYFDSFNRTIGSRCEYGQQLRAKMTGLIFPATFEKFKPSMLRSACRQTRKTLGGRNLAAG